MNKLPVAIIGYGFVGSAVAQAFDWSKTELTVVDPQYQNAVGVEGPTYVSLEELIHNPNPQHLTFICLPTPSADDRSVDTSIVESVLDGLNKSFYEGVIVVKSTLTPDFMEGIENKYPNLAIVYNPEFLTAKNAAKDFINPQFQVFGGDEEYIEFVERIYRSHTFIKNAVTYRTTMRTASFVKYAINSWLATKVVFMNELKNLYDKHLHHVQMQFNSQEESDWDTLVDILGKDVRVGPSHMQVPGEDGPGYAGACFPKDTKAFQSFANEYKSSMTVLNQVIHTNDLLRSNKISDASLSLEELIEDYDDQELWASEQLMG